MPTGQPGGWPPLADLAWSPGGTRIAYTENPSFTLMVTDSDGSGYRSLGLSAATPAWSPDGKHLAIANGSIQVLEADGTGGRVVAPADPNGGGQLRDPAWSPDGTTIAFSGWSGRDAIEAVSVDGTARRTVTAEDHFRLSHPAWSPDGKRIVFAAHGGYYGTWLGIVRSDGTGLRRIAAHCGGSSPTWSPDGTRIAFEDNYAIDVVDVDGAHRRRVPNSWYGHSPAWTADGKGLAFMRY